MNNQTLLDFMYLVPELYLLCLGMLILVFDLFIPERFKRRYIINLTVWGLLLSLILLVYSPAKGLILSNMAVVDPYSMFFKFLFIVSAVFVMVMARYYEPIKSELIGEFSALVVFATLGMMFMVSSNDLLMVFLSIEFVSIASFVLTGYVKNDPKSGEGALKYFLVGAFSAGIFIYGISLVVAATGTSNFTVMAETIQRGGFSPLFLTGFLLMLAGFGYKIAMVPFHTWAPEAYEGAPTPVTALLSVASKAAGFAVLLRVALVTVQGRADLALVLAVLSAVTMTAGNLMALQQDNVKRLLAYSGIAHAGYMLMGVVAVVSGIVTPTLGITSVLLYAFVYMVMNLGIFAIVIAFYNKTGSDDMRSYAGFSSKNPFLALVLVVFLISLAGVPPTAGFIGKFYVFSAILEAGEKFLWLAIIGVLNSVIALYYYFRIAYYVYFGTAKEGSRAELQTGIAVTIGIMVIVTLLVCVYPETFISAASESVTVVW